MFSKNFYLKITMKPEVKFLPSLACLPKPRRRQVEEGQDGWGD